MMTRRMMAKRLVVRVRGLSFGVRPHEAILGERDASLQSKMSKLRTLAETQSVPLQVEAVPVAAGGSGPGTARLSPSRSNLGGPDR